MTDDWSFDPATVQYVSLATFRRNGVEVRTPVWVAEHDSRYYLFSEGTAGKIKRIRANGRARVAACSLRGQVKSGWLKARGRIVQEPDIIQDAYTALRRKYGLTMKLSDFFAKLSGRYQKRAIIELEVTGVVEV